MPLIVIDSPKCYAVVSLYGGQILEFKAHNKPPLLWLSPLVIFELGKAIRGGVPICAPWFGPYKGTKRDSISYPNHGFARTSLWQQQSITTNQDDDIQIILTLTPNETSKLTYPVQFSMEICFTLGNELAIDFAVTNHSTRTIECEWALHSYLAIDDITTASVSGLEGYQYIDSANGRTVEILPAQLRFDGEVDRYFIQGSKAQSIDGAFPVSITGTNCDSVITWNPGTELAGKMSDIGSDFYQQFVCVERGAIFNNQWRIESGQQQRATMVLSN